MISHLKLLLDGEGTVCKDRLVSGGDAWYAILRHDCRGGHRSISHDNQAGLTHATLMSTMGLLQDVGIEVK